MEEAERFNNEFDAEKDKAQQEFEKQINDLRKNKNLSDLERMQKLDMVQKAGQRRLETKASQMQKDVLKKIETGERDLTANISRVQDRYKLWAVFLPPIPPLLVGLGVYFNRRAREREGVSKSRLR